MKKMGAESRLSVSLSPLLQGGVWVSFLEGERVSAFIRRVLCITDSQMAREVQTLILNNGCVDDPETRVLVPGDILVLSGAMPGLVGAMLRSNSPIKAMRSGLSVNRTAQGKAPLSGNYLKLKLFNTVLRDHQHDVLKQGFYAEERDG